MDQIFKMTERRFQVARRLIKTKPWDFFMMCRDGLDRLHHSSGSSRPDVTRCTRRATSTRTVFNDYYRFLDREIGTLLEVLPRRRDHDRR